MKYRFHWLPLVILFLVPIFFLQAVPLRKTAPVIDGDLSDPVWQGLPWRSSFTVLGKRTPAAARTRFKCFNALCATQGYFDRRVSAHSYH